MATAQVFRRNNFTLPAAAAGAGYFVSGNIQNPDNGSSIPTGHTDWHLVIDTTGLPVGQELVHVVVQYHYTSVQLGVTGLSNQGAVTNVDGTVTSITGGTFTGWIDDCGATLLTTGIDKLGNVTHLSDLGSQLNRILGAYPDLGRFLVLTSPGYASVPSVTFNIN